MIAEFVTTINHPTFIDLNEILCIVGINHQSGPCFKVNFKNSTRETYINYNQADKIRKAVKTYNSRTQKKQLKFDSLDV